MLFTFQVLLPAFLICLVFVGLLAYLGLHVLEREVIFVDIALAQIAALGHAVALWAGVEEHGKLTFAWSLAFTIGGAALFAALRVFKGKIPAEAFIGISYAVAAGFAVLVANALPHGDEEIKEILVGSLLTVELGDVLVTAAIFAAVALFHHAFRRRFWALSRGDAAQLGDMNAPLWDFLFYMSFGVVITTSVQTAGVLLVFSFLIVPAVFSALFAHRVVVRLCIAWTFGALVSALGLFASFQLDLPTGATVVMTFGGALALGALAYVLKPRTQTSALPVVQS